MTAVAAKPAVEGRRNRGAIFALPRFALLLLLAAALFLAEVAIGAVAIPLSEVLDVLVSVDSSNRVWRNIVVEFRLPRAINAAFSGAALGAAGIMLQTLFRNPLADPYVLGIAHGARLGAAALVVFTGLAGNAFLLRFGLVGEIGVAVASVAGCLLVLSILSVLSTRVSVVTLLLVGLMLGYLAVGLISVLLHFVDENHAKAFKAWDDASFAGATWRQLVVLVPGITVGLAASMALAKPLDAFLLGERYAASLGVAVKRAKLAVLLATGWFCGIVTAFCGPVAFVGLVAAQIARGMFGGGGHRTLLPASMLIGAIVALGADLVTHLPMEHHVFHLNAVIGLVGAPVALFVLLRSRSLRQWEAS
jgi:iron complex transport system permease protein